MNRTSRTMICVALLAASVGCGADTEAPRAGPASGGGVVAKPAALPVEAIARRLAAEAILRTVVGNLRTNGREDLTVPDLPLPTRLAIPVSWNSDDSAVQTTIQIIDNGLEVVALMSKSTEDIDRFIQVSAKSVGDTSNARALEIKNEMAFNQMITADRATQVVRAEQAIRSTIGPKLDTLQSQMAASIEQQLLSHPEWLKQFTDEKPPSDELKKSRAAVQSVLDEARRKAG